MTVEKEGRKLQVVAISRKCRQQSQIVANGRKQSETVANDRERL